MCGICGIIQTGPNALDIPHLQKMTDALAHRGPDGEGLWKNGEGTALLGHRRLSIIDLSEKAAQPMHWQDRYSIVYNGEIYNYLELKDTLIQLGYHFQTASDTEVILAAYDRYQDDCVDHLDGMFAFAIWDEQEKELFAARDRFGEKPFFYCLQPTGFIFASEMKAFWAMGQERKPNLKLFFNFLTIGYTDNPDQPAETFFENVFKLPPASRLYYSLADKELLIDRYWDIDTRVEDKNISETQAGERFKELLELSVRRRLRSDVAIGCSLSGGLDSSSILSTIHHLTKGQQKPMTFSAVFPGFQKDESSQIALVTQQFGVPNFTTTPTAEDFLADLDKLVYHQEEPIASASAAAQFRVFGKAHSQGIKVLLDGQGADETLAGYHKYYKWYWQELFQKRKLFRSHELGLARANGIHESFSLKNVAASFFPDLASVILERQYLLHALRHPDLSRDFIRLQSKEAYYSTPAGRNLKDALYFNTITHGLEELLRYADRNSMAHGAEVRLPFLNHDLVTFIFTLPARFKIRNGWTKWILRSGMEGFLPPAIVWQKTKIGFEPPQQEWMKHPVVQEKIRDARKKLVAADILKSSILDKPITATDAYAGGSDDWRYLMTAAFL